MSEGVAGGSLLVKSMEELLGNLGVQGTEALPFCFLTSRLQPATSHLPLAFAFLNPWFAVAGVGLMAIPIIIHILNRRRFKVIEWAAMSFLLAALRKNRRRLRFEQLLLLTVRCAVLVLLGLALARPLGCDQNTLATLVGHRSGLHVIIIDNSYSMSYRASRPHAVTHLEQAQHLAGRLVDRLSAGGEAVAVISTARPARTVVSPPTYDLQAARSAIARIEQSFAGTDLPGAMEQALRLARENHALPKKRLYIFSDSARSAWLNPGSSRLASLGPQLASEFSIAYFDLSQPGQSNQAVVDLRPTETLVRSGFPTDFSALVRGYGTTAPTTLIWRLQGQPLGSTHSLVPDQDTPPVIQPQAVSELRGMQVLEAALESEDGLSIDNRRWHVFNVAADLKVLIVEGRRSADALGGSGAFLELALAPMSPKDDPTLPRTLSYVEPERISDLELPNRVLGNYRAVILAGVSQVSLQQAEQLRRYVEQGGALLLFMGEAVNGQSYNQTLGTHGLLPGSLTRRIEATSDTSAFFFDFKPFGLLDPLLRIFQNRQRTGLDTAEVFAYWQVELAESLNVRRVLDYLPPRPGQPSDPAITVHEVGDGRVVFFSTSAGPEWTTLPTKPAYVTLMHELLSGSIAGSERWMNLTVGEVLTLPRNLQLMATPTLKDPQQSDVLLEQTVGPEGVSVWRSAELLVPGLYTLQTGDRSIPIAVNVPSEEADIRPLDSAARRTALGGIRMDEFGDDLPGVGDLRQAGNDFSWAVMVVLLVFVSMECLLAMRFGHHRR